MNHDDDSDSIEVGAVTREQIEDLAVLFIRADDLLVTARILGVLFVWAMLLSIGRILTWPHPEFASAIIPLTQVAICVGILFKTGNEKIKGSQVARLLRNLCIAASCLATGTALAFEQPVVVLGEFLVLVLVNNVPLEFVGLAVWAELECQFMLRVEAFLDRAGYSWCEGRAGEHQEE